MDYQMILVAIIIAFIVAVLCAGSYWRDKSERLESENHKLKQHIEQLKNSIK